MVARHPRVRRGASVVTSYQAENGPSYSAAEAASFALLPTAIGGRPTSLSQDFRAAAGDTISGWAFFDNANWADQDIYGAVTIKAGTQTVATLFRADAASTGDFGQTPWTPFSYTFSQAGNYRIEAAAKDVFEAQNTSYLGFDGVVFSGVRDPGQPQLLDMNPTDNGTEEGSPIEFNGVFHDATYGDSHQVVVDWGDGTQSTLLPVSGAADVSTGLVNPANGHVYYRLSEYVSWADGERGAATWRAPNHHQRCGRTGMGRGRTSSARGGPSSCGSG